MWWSPQKSVVQIYDQPLEWNASPRVDSLSNIHWNPSTPRVSIPHEKLKWNGQPRVNSLDNADYKSSGGYISPVYHQKLDFKHVQPRINTGFID